MVDSIKPSVGALGPRTSPYSTSQPVRELEPNSGSSYSEEAQSYWNRIERRKAADRRRNRNSHHPKFEMRYGRGRRKGDRRYPTIETKA